MNLNSNNFKNYIYYFPLNLNPKPYTYKKKIITNIEMRDTVSRDCHRQCACNHFYPNRIV